MTNLTKKVSFYFMNLCFFLVLSSCSLLVPCHESPAVCQQRYQSGAFLNQMSSDQAAQSAAMQMHSTPAPMPMMMP